MWGMRFCIMAIYRMSPDGELDANKDVGVDVDMGVGINVDETRQEKLRDVCRGEGMMGLPILQTLPPRAAYQ